MMWGKFKPMIPEVDSTAVQMDGVVCKKIKVNENIVKKKIHKK